MSRLNSRVPERAYDLGELRPGEEHLLVACGPLPVEVNWIVHWIDPTPRDAPRTFQICDGWLEQGGSLVYRWTLRAE